MHFKREKQIKERRGPKSQFKFTHHCYFFVDTDFIFLKLNLLQIKIIPHIGSLNTSSLFPDYTSFLPWGPQLALFQHLVSS